MVRTGARGAPWLLCVCVRARRGGGGVQGMNVEQREEGGYAHSTYNTVRTQARGTARATPRESRPSSMSTDAEIDPIFAYFEKVWIVPCMSTLPQPLHGLCLFGPAMLAAALVMLLVAILAWCERRNAMKSSAPTVSKGGSKAKKSKKVD